MTFTFISSSASDLRFLAASSEVQQAQLSEDRTNLSSVRRPHRGIQIKDDTYASLSIFKANGSHIPLVSSSAQQKEVGEGFQGYVKYYSDFILQSIRVSRQEKHQIIETFGNSFIYFFGERPTMVRLSGLLINSEDFNWRSQFWANYDTYLRGTKLAQQNARCFLSYDRTIIEGYPVEASAEDREAEPYLVPFSMTLFLTNYQDFSQIGSVLLPDHQDGQDFSGVDVLNRELTDSASARSSLTGQTNFGSINASADVRAFNFQESVDAGKGFGGFLREASSFLKNNAITNFLGDIKKGLDVVLTGRVISRPAGSAGFLAQIGDASVAPGTLATSFFDSTDISNVQLRVPQAVKFVFQPNLRVPIYRNWDEYPLTFGSEVQLDSSVLRTAKLRIKQRRALVQQQNAVFAALEQSIETENNILRTLADIANFTRKGFALVSTAKSFINDPGAVAAEATGVSGLSGTDVTFGIPGIT